MWTRTWQAWRALLLLAVAAAALATPAAARDDTGELRLAIAEVDDAIPLADIVSGSARIGFDPLVGQGLGRVGNKDKTVWLRLRMDLPEDGVQRFVSLPRQGIQHLRVAQGPAPEIPGPAIGIGQAEDAAEAGGAAAPAAAARWADAFVLPVAGDAGGTTTVYLGVQGYGTLNLQPRLLTVDHVRAEAGAASRMYDLLYGTLLLVGVLAVVRRWTGGERRSRLAQAAFACLAASLVDNFHLQLSMGHTSLAAMPNVPVALWVLACATLLRATEQYAGHEKNTPDFARALDWLAYVFAAIAVGLLFVPLAYLPHLQVTGLCLLAATALICGSSLFLDPRHWRWTPIMVWLGVLLALLAIPLSMLQLLPANALSRRGFQFLLALQLAVYLILPWIRQALRERAKLKRNVAAEPSAEEKIAHAREWVISSLQAGIESAAEGDMEWIAYRRLMAGLKPVLPQTAAAVVAMNYHNEDLLLVEPKEAEPRFRMLLTQRASLLKNLSRSLAPQQIVIDFDGPEGPLQHVMLAIIPLPIERPGWGALVIEREAEATYSEAELDLCAEFASLATTAADEAGQVMQMRLATEIDPESGAFKREMIEQLLLRANEVSVQKRKPLSMLRVGVDDFEAIPPEAAAEVARSVADAIRDEIDYGETIGRQAGDQFVVLLAGRAVGEARTLAERICATVRKQSKPAAPGEHLSVSIGVSQVLPGERSPQLMIERSNKALAKARQFGGNQVQAVVASTP